MFYPQRRLNLINNLPYDLCQRTSPSPLVSSSPLKNQDTAGSHGEEHNICELLVILSRLL